MSQETEKPEVQDRIERALYLKDRLDELIDLAVDFAENPDKLRSFIPDTLLEKLEGRFIPEDGFDINPEHVRQVKDRLLDSEELEQAEEGWDDRRPIRFLIMGEQGVGKSSFVNAMAGEYVARVGEEPGRESIVHESYEIEQDSYDIQGEKSMEVIDSRGLADLERENEQSAYEDLVEVVSGDKTPDAVIFLLEAKKEAHLEDNLERLKDLQEEVGLTFPVIVIANKVDNFEPDDEKNPEDFSEKKLRRIEDAEDMFRETVDQPGINLIDVIGVQSKIQWDGEPKEDGSNWSDLEIETDRRYNIDKVRRTIADSVELEAGIHFLLQTKAKQALHLFAKQFVYAFAWLGASIAAGNQIPLTDMAVLFPLEIVMILMIAYIGGRDINRKSFSDNSEVILEFLGSFGVVGLLGLSAKLAADQLPDFFPIIGAPADATLTGMTVYGIGMAAIAYFIDDVRDASELRTIMYEALKDAKKIFEQSISLPGDSSDSNQKQDQVDPDDAASTVTIPHAKREIRTSEDRWKVHVMEAFLQEIEFTLINDDEVLISEADLQSGIRFVKWLRDETDESFENTIQQASDSQADGVRRWLKWFLILNPFPMGKFMWLMADRAVSVMNKHGEAEIANALVQERTVKDSIGTNKVNVM